MMMNFRPRNNYEVKERRKKIVTFSIVIVILIIFFSTPFGSKILFAVVKPFWKSENNSIGFISSKNDLLRSKSSLIEENQNLKDELEKSKQQSELFATLQAENEELKNILGRKSQKEKLILSAVLVKPFFSPYDTLIIDVGSNAGIKEGDTVIADGDTHIGYIKEVYGNSSKVVLYSSNGEVVKVLIGPNNIEKEAKGIGAGNFLIEAPVESGISEGDTIVIPSISTNVFGIVEKIEKKENDSIEKVFFKSSVNINELKWVEVIS